MSAGCHIGRVGGSRVSRPSPERNPASICRTALSHGSGDREDEGREGHGRDQGPGSEEPRQGHHDVDGEKGSKSASVTATDGHPFWVPELGEWIDATDLKSGSWLRTSAGVRVQITAVERWTAQEATVHKLTVSDLHTYYVLAGAAPVLVHNSSPAQCDLLFPGPNAREGVEVSEFGEMSAAETAQIQDVGARLGCYSCGATNPRVSGHWTPDHQPITSLVLEGTPQMLYPHCETCMRGQGNVAIKLLTGRNPQGYRRGPSGLIVPRNLLNAGTSWSQRSSGLWAPGA